MNNIVIATNGQEEMHLENFLLWELEGGKGTYEGGRNSKDPLWDDLALEKKMTYMANSIMGDIISGNWRLEII